MSYGLGPMEFIILALVVVIIIGWFWIWYRIFWKCTGNGWLSLFMIVPLINVILLIYAAAVGVPDLSERPRGT